MAIAIIGMLDEREEAVRVIRDEIEKRGHKTLVIDISVGTGAIVPTIKPDIHAQEILLSVSPSERIDDRKAHGDTAATAMAEGLARKVGELHARGELEGVIAIAGMTGSLIALKAMSLLPFGMPKLLISSAAAMPAHASQLAEYLGSHDITVMHTVVDTVGTNGLVRSLAANGANAISGMVEGLSPGRLQERDAIAMTEFGFCDRGAYYIREMLGDDYEMVSFHATGLSDMAARDLVREGRFKAFIDLVPSTFCEYLLGGNRASGPDRLDMARDVPIPYIFCPGGFDLISCGPIGRREQNDPLWESRRLAQRRLHVQDALRVQARTSPVEMEQVATAVAERLNRYTHRSLVRVIIPTRGFSSLDVEHGPLHDPAADGAFIRVLKERLHQDIAVSEVDSDINSREFAAVVAAAARDALCTCSTGVL